LKKVWASEKWGFNFEDNVVWRIGDANHIKFWEDKWFASKALNVRFPRLYSITKDKNVVVSQVRVWVNNMWSWKVEWRRTLFEWEIGEELHLLSLLEDKSLSLGSKDQWVWKPDEGFGYIVSSTYSRLRMVEVGTFGSLYKVFLEP